MVGLIKLPDDRDWLSTSEKVEIADKLVDEHPVPESLPPEPEPDEHLEDAFDVANGDED